MCNNMEDSTSNDITILTLVFLLTILTYLTHETMLPMATLSLVLHMFTKKSILIILLLPI